MSPVAPLTPKQLKLLEWIESFVLEKGYMPSRREMADGVGVSSVATIQQHVEAIEAKGYLKLKEGGSRGVEFSRRWENSKANRLAAVRKAAAEALSEREFSGASSRSRSRSRSASASSPSSGLSPSSLSEFAHASEFTVPLLGRVAAGYPIEVFSNEESVSVPIAMRGSGKKKLFALRVQGDSMMEDGILNGDLVVCEERETARSGETVVALWKGEATLKRLEKTRTGIELHPANPQYPVMQVKDGDSFQVQGVLTGVLRTYGIHTRLGSGNRRS